jgi:quercetin dioxygenase-like cupin family protein
MEGHAYLRTHDLSGEHMLLDLAEVVTEMHGDSPRGRSRGAVTLVKQSGMTVLLTHLHSGGSLQEHAAPGPATVQVLDGRVQFEIGDERFEVPAGRLVAFDAGIRHSVKALEDSTLLLTLSAAGG